MNNDLVILRATRSILLPPQSAVIRAATFCAASGSHGFEITPAVDRCAETRPRIVSRGRRLIDETQLRAAGVEAVIKLPDNVFHVLVGLNADRYAAEMKGQLALTIVA
ncbi:MAG TPA: hypothetical protein VKF81_00080 [Blastocatellia bacterium]|nr:hypothetical protein [Blastocatellia bacterium]